MLSISIIIPVYNVERYVGRCLESVISQNIDGKEVIIVDDGSTDSSGTICDEYAHNHSEFKIIHQKNQGLSAARNVASKQAQGEYIMFVDSDDFLAPNSLAPLLKLALEHQLDVLGFNNVMVAEEANSAPIKTIESPKSIQVFNGADFIAQHNFATMVWRNLIKRDIIMENGLHFPIGHMIEDAGYNLLLFLKAKRIAKVPNVVYCYRQRSSSIMNNSNKEHLLRLLPEYLWAASYVNKITNDNKDVLQGDAYERCRSQRDSYVFFGAIRAFKLGKTKEYINQAKSNGQYPFKRLSHDNYPGLLITVLHWCVHEPWLWRLMSKIYCRMKK